MHQRGVVRGMHSGPFLLLHCEIPEHASPKKNVKKKAIEQIVETAENSLKIKHYFKYAYNRCVQLMREERR